MAQPYVGEIRIFAGNFAPQGYATCDGQTLAIAQNQALFALIGTTYGGDGVTTFALPNLDGRIVVGQGTGASTYVIGQSGGAATVTLTAAMMPAHAHTISADEGAATTGNPAGAYFATATPKTPYSVPGGGSNPKASALKSMSPAMLATTGGGVPHNNMQPYQTVTYIIALFGVFPSQN